MKRAVKLCGFVTLLFCAALSAAQSLGEVARQERARKNSNPQSVRRVYFNEDLSKPIDPLNKSDPTKSASSETDRPVNRPQPVVEELRSKIRNQKHKVQLLQEQVDKIQRRIDERESNGTVTMSQRALVVSSTGEVAQGPCAVSKANYYDPYKDWCAEPAKLASELDKLRPELEEAQAALKALQDQARKMGYGNAFFDPD
jgi:hypothetical protein